MIYKKLLANNKIWAENKVLEEANYFNDLAKGQSPEILMIGCSDSRVSLETILGTKLGDLFIHRNIANQVNITDINFLSVLEYALENLRVKHVIIMGHYDCGGVNAAVNGTTHSIVENWITPIRDLYFENIDKLKLCSTEKQKLNKLSELNVINQARNIFKTSVMQRLLEENNAPQVHAWIFDIYSGKIKEVDY